MFAHENLVKNYFAFESIILLNSYKELYLILPLNLLKSVSEGLFSSAHLIALSILDFADSSCIHISLSGIMLAVLMSHTPSSISSIITCLPAYSFPRDIWPLAPTV